MGGETCDQPYNDVMADGETENESCFQVAIPSLVSNKFTIRIKSLQGKDERYHYAEIRGIKLMSA